MIAQKASNELDLLIYIRKSFERFESPASKLRSRDGNACDWMSKNLVAHTDEQCE